MQLDRCGLVHCGPGLVFLNFTFIATGPGPVAQPLAQKTGPDWTLKHYTVYLLQ
jgi:hypothetical protein